MHRDLLAEWDAYTEGKTWDEIYDRIDEFDEVLSRNQKAFIFDDYFKSIRKEEEDFDDEFPC